MRLARELRSPLAPALALTAAALFFSRDPGSSSLPWIGYAALLLVGILFATQSPPSGAAVLLPLGALALWSAVSIAWSIEPDRSWDYSNRAFVYLAFALVGALLPVDPPKLLYGFAGLLGAVAVWALAGKVVPGLHGDDGGISRLSAPVGYWNSLALLGDIALPIGLCLATRRRAAGTLLVFGWIVTIGLTYSRGGVIVGIVVVGLWMLLSRAWVDALSTLVAAGLPAASALALAFSLSGLTSDGQPHAARVRDGLVFGVVLLVDAAVAVALSRFSFPKTETMRRISIGLLALTAAGMLAVGAVHARGWWHELADPGGVQVTNGASRFADAGSNLRSAWWREAWSGFEATPLKGTGAGSFEFTNLRYRKSNVDEALEPHDLPLQFLSETGIVGFALFIGAVGWLIVAARRKPGPQLALALALPAYFLHGLLDIDWDFTSVSAPVFLIAGALAVRRTKRSRPRGFTIFTASSALLAVCFSLFAVWLGNHWESQAETTTNAMHSLLTAQRVRTINPFTVDPLWTAANAEIELASAIKKKHAPGWRKAFVKTNGLAEGFLKKATEVQPDNAEAWYLLGSFALYPPPGGSIQPCARLAYDAFNRFNVLNGQDSNNVYFGKALKIVNAGKAKC